jgi:transposase-like protein
MSQNKIYTKEEKELIVKEYLAGNVSLQMLTEKYNLSSRKTLYSWVKKYKENGTIYSINKNIDSLESSSRMNITTSDIELDR